MEKTRWSFVATVERNGSELVKEGEVEAGSITEATVLVRKMYANIGVVVSATLTKVNDDFTVTVKE